MLPVLQVDASMFSLEKSLKAQESCVYTVLLGLLFGEGFYKCGANAL